jgi:hypothetical protein
VASERTIGARRSLATLGDAGGGDGARDDLGEIVERRPGHRVFSVSAANAAAYRVKRRRWSRPSTAGSVSA